MLIAINFKDYETHVERRIGRIYTLDDAAFMHELGGNRAQALINGDEIFPAMLGEIRAATASITFESHISHLSTH